MGADLVVGDVAVILETVTAPTAAVTATASVSETHHLRVHGEHDLIP
jgi:hypothetical protein